MLRALPMRYAGVEFRSRLEARWAYNLDRLGIAWRYEPEGVELSTGEWYSPDFYLPECTTWLEVKGDHDERIDKVQQFARDVDDLVLIGRTPRDMPSHAVDEYGFRHYLAAQAPLGGTWSDQNEAFAVVMTCPHCGLVQFLAVDDAPCRGCEMVSLEWQGATPDYRFRMGVDEYLREFHHLAAPSGGGR